MKHVYNITGMTCNGCRASVEDTLRTLDGVQNVDVKLDTGEAYLESSTYVSLETLQKALLPKYHVSKSDVNIPNVASNLEEKSYIQKLYPLFLIFGYITVASILLNIKSWNTSSFMLDFMGLFYVVFSFFKLLDLKGFPQSFKMYDPLAKILPIYAWVYPFIELILGLQFLMRIQIVLALIVTLIILGITTIGVTNTLLKKKSMRCACLGTALKLPMTKATFIENSIMIVMAILMLLHLN